MEAEVLFIPLVLGLLPLLLVPVFKHQKNLLPALARSSVFSSVHIFRFFRSSIIRGGVKTTPEQVVSSSTSNGLLFLNFFLLSYLGGWRKVKEVASTYLCHPEAWIAASQFTFDFSSPGSLKIWIFSVETKQKSLKTCRPEVEGGFQNSHSGVYSKLQQQRPTTREIFYQKIITLEIYFLNIESFFRTHTFSRSRARSKIILLFMFISNNVQFQCYIFEFSKKNPVCRLLHIERGTFRLIF